MSSKRKVSPNQSSIDGSGSSDIVGKKQPHRRNCGFSRYRDTLRDLSVGSKKFGKAVVDCCFFGSESKWGLIGDETVGIIYFELTLSQCSDYRLDSVDVQMTFKADSTTNSPTVMKYIAPKKLFGPAREVDITDSLKLTAQVDISGFGGVNLGEISRNKEYKLLHKWAFIGDRLSEGNGLYQIVRWVWDSNPQELQAEVRHLHLAVTLQHQSIPFSVEVGVNGKLRRHMLRAMFKTHQNKTMAQIVPKKQRRDLLSDAENLEEEIKRKNVGSLPSTFFLWLRPRNTEVVANYE